MLFYFLSVRRVFYFGDIYQMPFCICNYIELLFINKYVCKVITYSPIDRTMSPVLGQLPNIFLFIAVILQEISVGIGK